MCSIKSLAGLQPTRSSWKRSFSGLIIVAIGPVIRRFSTVPSGFPNSIYMQKITPFLWFDSNGEEALNLYLSVFKDGKVINIQRMDGKVFSGTFELFGQQFHFLNGGPRFQFTEAISMMVDCKTQEEVDAYWDGLIDGGGQAQACGWLKDRFGLSWQIIPKNLGRYLSDPDRAKANRVMQAMLKMVKLDMAALDDAYNG